MRGFKGANYVLRCHFRRDGRAKQKLTHSEAQLKAKQVHANAYECSVCGSWHIGGAR